MTPKTIVKCPHCKKVITKRDIVKSIQPIISFAKNDHKRKSALLKTKWNKNVNVFIGKNLTDFHKNKIFQADIDDKSVTLHYKTDVYLSTVLRDAGIFDSISEAKGAGWLRKAEEGFHDEIIQVKRRLHRLTILKEKL